MSQAWNDFLMLPWYALGFYAWVKYIDYTNARYDEEQIKRLKEEQNGK